MRIVRRMLHGGGQLLHAGRGFAKRRRLLFSAGGEIDIPGGDFISGMRHAVAGIADLNNNIAQGLAHLFKRGKHPANFITGMRNNRIL